MRGKVSRRREEGPASVWWNRNLRFYFACDSTTPLPRRNPPGRPCSETDRACAGEGPVHRCAPIPKLYAELAKAPEKARAKRNPLEKDPDAVAAGRNLFEQHCAECHGDLAEGGRKAPSLRVEQVQNAEPGVILWILTNGVL